MATFQDVLMTILRGALLGDFDFTSVGSTSIGVILFLFMKLFASTLLLTIFIAVISDIYISLQKANEERWELYVTSLLVENVKSESKSPLEHILDLRRHIMNLFRKKKPRREASAINLVVEQPSKDTELKEKTEIEEEEEDAEEIEEEKNRRVPARTYEDEELDEIVLEIGSKREEEQSQRELHSMQHSLKKLESEMASIKSVLADLTRQLEEANAKK